MSTTEADIKIDLDAADAEKAAKAAPQPADTPEIEVAPPKPEPKPAETKVLKPEEGLDKLKKQLEDEKLARQDAERRAAESAEAERQARTEKQGTELDLVTNAIATVTQANDQLEEKYAAALQAGDFAGAAKINREMSNNSAKLLQLESGKQRLESAPKPVARAPQDPVEKFAQSLSPQSAAWVRSHPEYVRDPKKNSKMLAAHQMALADDIAADSPEYFAAIERTLGLSMPDPEPDADPMAEAARPAARRSAPAAAPVTRSGNGAGPRPNVVTLSPAEVEMAKMMDMTPEEYARNKVALKKDGRLN